MRTVHLWLPAMCQLTAPPPLPFAAALAQAATACTRAAWATGSGARGSAAAVPPAPCGELPVLALLGEACCSIPFQAHPLSAEPADPSPPCSRAPWQDGSANTGGAAGGKDRFDNLAAFSGAHRGMDASLEALYGEGEG